MLKTSNTVPTTKNKVGKNKIVLGFAALAASAIVGTTGMAAAAQNNQQNGTGYSGNTVNVGIDVRGDNNVINIVIRMITGGN
jgi:hypothetical protein